MFSNIKAGITNKLKTALSWKTKRKILVIESDDWGSIRMPSVQIYSSLVSKGIQLNSHGGQLFNQYDNLANEDDLNALFDVLLSVKDVHGNPAVFTAVCVVANPDFEKIKKNNFDQYFYEPFTTTLERYQGHNRTFTLWKDGIDNKIFIPQSHSREHLNSILWMRELQKGDMETHIAFDHGMWGFDRKNNLPSYQIAFSIKDKNDLKQQATIIHDGLNLFENIFGYRAQFFVPPNGVLHTKLEGTTKENNISYLYGSFLYKIPGDDYTFRNTIRYMGMKNKYNQINILRNCLFEPNEPGHDWVGIALRDIEYAFSHNLPAILGPHRKNFIGSLDENNRRSGLKALKSLLQNVKKKWPDVEFMTTIQLGEVMKESC